MRKTKIICTLGPSTDKDGVLRELVANGMSEADVAALAARMPNIVNTARGGYSGGTSEHARFAVASQIDTMSAIEACSWGMFQIMGYHWARLGYIDAQDFKLHMQESEGEQLQAFSFDPNVRTIGDLREGMTLPGIVTNITAFGAFVDIGIKQDGLVHISQMADRYVASPAEVVHLGQQVKVRVTGIDTARGRISLSMRK